MAIGEVATGVSNIGTLEYDLINYGTTKAASTLDGIYQLFVDLSNMTANEQYILRIYEKVRPGDTQRLVQQVEFSGFQGEPIYVTPALLLLHGWTFTLQRVATGGSSADRSIAWSIRQVA